jgi:hypothetical protein
MNEYKIQQRILTLAECAVLNKDSKPPSFEVNNIVFSHWDFNWGDGWLTDWWLAESNVKAKSASAAYGIFSRRLIKVVPRIAFISQGYIAQQLEPFMIHKKGTDFVFFRYTQDAKAGGLMFMEKELRALKYLLTYKEVSDEFFYFWNDAVNTPSYPSKLLLMFSAIESLARHRNKLLYKDKYSYIEKILGKELAKEIFNDRSGLRNRLAHGEYFQTKDGEKNYVEIVHKRIISYFNNEILNQKILEEDVVSPQRHPFGNKNESNNYIRSRSSTSNLNIYSILKDFDTNDIHNLKDYEYVFDESVTMKY